MIIESLLDTDLYKFTMMQCVLHQFPDANVKYRFRCRTEGVDLSPYVDEIREEIEHLCTLTMKEDELDYLGNLRFIKSDFVDFLSLFHLKSKYVTVAVSSEMPCGIDIVIEGPWLHTILFEIPILAIVNEVYFRHTVPEPDEAPENPLDQERARQRKPQDQRLRYTPPLLPRLAAQSHQGALRGTWSDIFCWHE